MGGTVSKTASDADFIRFFTDPTAFFLQTSQKDFKPKTGEWACDQFHSLKGLLGDGQKSLYAGQKAVQWLDDQKSAIRTDLDLGFSPKMIREAYEDGIKIIKDQPKAPFGAWLGHRILSDGSLDKMQKMDFLIKLLATKKVSMDEILATAPKKTCLGILRMLGQDSSPSLASLIGRYGSPKIIANVVDIVARGVAPEKRAGVLQDLLSEVRGTKAFTEVVHNLEGKGWELFLDQAKSDPDLKKRLFKELSQEELIRRFVTDADFQAMTVGQIQTERDFVKFLEGVSKVSSMESGALGYFMTQAMKVMDPMLFQGALNQVFKKPEWVTAFAYGILGDKKMQGKLADTLQQKELQQLTRALMVIQGQKASVLDYLTNTPMFTSEDYSTHQDAKSAAAIFAGKALTHMALKMGSKKFQALYSGFSETSVERSKLAQLVVDSPDLQAQIGKEWGNAQTGALIDSILGLKIKKREMGKALLGINGSMPGEKKNAVWHEGIARLRGFLETQLSLSPRDFEKKVLYKELSASGAVDIKFSLKFLAAQARNNPEVINPDHIGLVVTNTQSSKVSKTASATVGMEIGSTNPLLAVKVTGSASRGRTDDKEKGKSTAKNMDTKVQQDRKEKVFGKTWRGFYLLTESLLKYVRQKSKGDEKFKKEYYEALDRANKDFLKQKYE